jgi:hypothetical protein
MRSKISPGGAVTEIIDASGDGGGNVLASSWGLAVDGNDNVYVAGLDTDNVFEITPGGSRRSSMRRAVVGMCSMAHVVSQSTRLAAGCSSLARQATTHSGFSDGGSPVRQLPLRKWDVPNRHCQLNRVGVTFRLVRFPWELGADLQARVLAVSKAASDEMREHDDEHDLALVEVKARSRVP